MENYEHDIFYETGSLSLDQKKNLLKEMRDRSIDWHVDILNCSISWARRKIEMKFEEILDKLLDDSHFVFIHRKGFKDAKGNPLPGEYLLEAGFSTMDYNPDTYYLWIYCDSKEIPYFVDKYDLKPNIM